ncbi:hypothetical protein [Allorhodopirellula solitaria]|uniref:hypothetical protein n=1 Tax=Allorhodopirellula solitaria TaxID=2527987 RepID=UPI0011B5EE26|nr:hypothetical protein [Allorhodopirellula solitaria]
MANDYTPSRTGSDAHEVEAGIFPGFRQRWIATVVDSLNDNLLPDEFDESHRTDCPGTEGFSTDGNEVIAT